MGYFDSKLASLATKLVEKGRKQDLSRYIYKFSLHIGIDCLPHFSIQLIELCEKLRFKNFPREFCNLSEF